VSGPAYLSDMDEWMRNQEKRITSVERRRRRGDGTGGGGGNNTTVGGFHAVGAESNDRSVQFIQSMMRPSMRIQSDAKIRPDVIWPPDYIGPVTGSYDIPMAGEATGPATPLVVATPVGTIADSYRGLVSGSLAAGTAPAAGMTVQAYKRSDTDYIMPSVTTVDSTTGFWTLDLSTTPDWQAGQWVFALIVGGAQAGRKWPYPVSYTQIRVENRVITDTSYLVGTTTEAIRPAPITGRFTFEYTLQGRKEFRLSRPDGSVLARYAPLTGCARSYLVGVGEPGYGTEFINQTYSYDQALVLLAMIASGERESAAAAARGLLLLQTTSGAEIGGFIFSGSQLSPSLGDAAYRTGAHCFCLYAILAYYQAWPDDAGQNFTLSITRAMAWLDRYLDPSGLYLGGKGVYTGGGAFNPNTPITWAATEHNIDAWFCWDLAYTIFSTGTYLTKANALKTAMMNLLWSNSLGRFLQGMGPGGVPDYGDPLDCHSWGAMFLVAIGDPTKASSIMTDAMLAPFKFTIDGLTGYAPAYAADPAYPDATPTVWSEGTFGVALAFLALEDKARWIVTNQNMMAGQEKDGSYRYVSVKNVPYEWTNSKAVIGCAWGIMSLAGHGIWQVEATPRS
jgi:hypothetical protein